MSWNAMVAALSAVLVIVSSSPDTARGVSAGGGPEIRPALARSGASWFYNWTADTSASGTDLDFVPMVWGRESVNHHQLALARRHGKELLTFNEPDRPEQADLQVEEALDLWPRLQRTGMRLGSPAVANGAADNGGWLDRFMHGAEQRGLRVDFVAVHWYGGYGGDFNAQRTTSQLRNYLTSVHRRYGKPVWLTEYALIDFADGVSVPDARQQARFAARSVRMLDSLRWLERYAWFSLTGPRHGPSTALVRANGSRTPAGRAYAQR